MGEDGHQQQVHNGDGDDEIAGQRFPRGVQLVAGTGDIDVHIRRQGTTFAHGLKQFRAYPFNAGLKRHIVRGNHVQGHGAATIHPADGAGIHGFLYGGEAGQGQGRALGRVHHDIGQTVQ